VNTLKARQEALGATFGGDGSVEHFGDWRGEYSAVRVGAGFAERTDRALLRMWGRDPVRMLNGLITNQLSPDPGGHAIYAAMLTPKGRIITDLLALVLDPGSGREVLVDVPAEARVAASEQLKKYIPPLFARWEELTPSHTVLGVYGPRAEELVRDVLGGVPPGEEGSFTVQQVEEAQVAIVSHRGVGGEPGFDILLPKTLAMRIWMEFEDRAEAFGARPVGSIALEALRVEAGRPRFGRELTEETLPGEAFITTGLMERAVSFTKGCYTGQEVVVRIAHRGHVNRHLRGLLLDAAPPPRPRTPLYHPESGKEVGWTTTATFSPLMDGTIALAYLRREIVPGDRVRVGSDGAMAVVSELPFRRAAPPLESR